MGDRSAVAPAAVRLPVSAHSFWTELDDTADRTLFSRTMGHSY